jgi:hypothetical protein
MRQMSHPRASNPVEYSDSRAPRPLIFHLVTPINLTARQRLHLSPFLSFALTLCLPLPRRPPRHPVAAIRHRLLLLLPLLPLLLHLLLRLLLVLLSRFFRPQHVRVHGDAPTPTNLSPSLSLYIHVCVCVYACFPL